MTASAIQGPEGPPPPPSPPHERVRRIAIETPDKRVKICGIFEGEAPTEILFEDTSYILLRDKERYVLYVPSTPSTPSVH